MQKKIEGGRVAIRIIINAIRVVLWTRQSNVERGGASL